MADLLAVSPPIRPDGPGWADVAGFVAEVADPVVDLLMWADVASSLGRLADIRLLRAGDRPVALAFAFPLWPERPALGVKGRTPADEAAMLTALVRGGAWRCGYVICPTAQEALWLGHGQATGRQGEVHMTVAAADWRPPADGPRVRPGSFEEVDRFYSTHGAAAWHPAQFETGPYMVGEADGEIVAAAGTHFSYPALAQLGNVLTAPAHRGHGWARATTAAVTAALVARGHATISLFVAADNAPARHVYRQLGFADLRELAAFSWDA